MNILSQTGLQWQYPAITEKYAFDQISNFDHPYPEAIYIGIPWTTLLDRFNVIEKHHYLSIDQYLKDTIRMENLGSSPKVTVCQSILFRNLLGYFNELGIRYLFASHALESEYSKFYNEYGILVMPFSLYPVITSEIQPLENKEYLYSFIGCIEYGKFSEEAVSASQLRQRITQLDHPSDTLVKSIDNWHFDHLVYDHQIKGGEIDQSVIHKMEQRQEEYREIMSKSTFCLCPKGTGPNTIRFWEALQSGCIPVVISDNFWYPNYNIDWAQCTIQISEKNVNHLPEILSEMENKTINKLYGNCLSTRTRLLKENFVHPIRMFLQDL